MSYGRRAARGDGIDFYTIVHRVVLVTVIFTLSLPASPPGSASFVSAKRGDQICSSQPAQCDNAHDPIPMVEAASHALSAGFAGEDAATIVAIAWAESGGNPFACNYNPGSGSWDRGILQINDYWHSEIDDACAFDPDCAFLAAYIISNQGSDFTDWVTYNGSTRIRGVNRDTRANL